MITHSKSNEHLLVWTLVCSILLHALLALVLPNFDFSQQEPPKQELTIELVQPKQPEPLQEAPPAPVTPDPIPEPVKEIPKPIKKTEVPLERKPIPQPVTDEPAPQEAAPPPEVIAVAPKAESKPVFVAPPPPPEPPKRAGPSESDIQAARDAYRSQVQLELKRNQRYPRIAESRGIEGDVKLEISIDHDGNVTQVAVEESSGNSALDDAAIAAVKRSNLKQYMQDILRGHIDKITVTVGFKLA